MSTSAPRRGNVLRVATAAAGLSAALASGCAGLPEPLALPRHAPTVEYDPHPAAGRAEPLRVRVEVLAVREPPPGAAPGLAAATIAADRGAPFRGRSRLPVGSLWIAGEHAARWRESAAAFGPAQLQSLGTAIGVVASDLRTWLRADGTPLPALRLARVDAGIAVVLVTAGDDATEELTIADPVGEGATAAVFVPGGVGPRGGYLLQFAGDGPPSDGELAAAAGGEADVAPGPTGRPAAWRVALAAVGADNRRPALLALIRPLDLPRVVDLVLAADEPALIAITNALAPVEPSAADVAWRIERATWQALQPRIERDELTPALAAATARHLGAVASDAAQLTLMLQNSADCAAFGTALHDENLVALGDRSAAVRVRANAWLVARDVVVAGYDPLGEERGRRRALRRYRTVTAAKVAR